MTKLRFALLADPYFAGVPSFRPGRKQTALGFHARDDVPEVRYAVFKLLAERKDDLRFHAVVADKTVIAAQEIEKRRLDPQARYQKNSLYDDLIRQLYRKFHRIAGEYLTAFTVGDQLLWGAAEPLRPMLGLLRSRGGEAAHPARAEAT